MTNLCSLQLLTMRKYSNLVQKDHQLSSSCHLELILYQIFRNLLMIKDFPATNSSISHLDKVWRNKPTFTYQLLPIEDIGLCYKIATYLLLGSRITLKSSFKLYQDQIKISDSGSQLSQLMLSPLEFCRKLLRSSLNHQMV